MGTTEVQWLCRLKEQCQTMKSEIYGLDTIEVPDEVNKMNTTEVLKEILVLSTTEVLDKIIELDAIEAIQQDKVKEM